MTDDRPRSRPEPPAREAYRHFGPVQTRWSDNDAYGHVNNVVYLAWFDMVVNRWLIDAGLLDLQRGDGTIGLVVETHCDYFAPLAFPEAVEAGLRVARIGTSSVRYEVGLFAAGAPRAAACGQFVHVQVDRRTRRPAALGPRHLAALKGLL